MSVSDLTWPDVVSVGGELARVTPLAQTSILSYVNRRIDPTKASALFDDDEIQLLRKYLAAHMGALTLLKGKAGPVASESVGGLSKSFSVALTDPLWDVTSYGRMFRTLARMSGAVAGFTA